MKKILLIIGIIFLISILSIFLFKENKIISNDNISTFDYKYPLYKEELKDEYLKYQKETNLPIKKAIIYVNIGLNHPFYSNVKEAKKNTLTILVNKYNYLPKDYEPNDLVTMDEYAKEGLRFNNTAYQAFKQMAKDAYEDNLHLRIVSAYRSYDYQNKLYNNYLKYDTKEKVDTYSARAGYSEHQTGLAIDIDNGYVNYDRFHITQEFNWMRNNAYKYGFILRYPLGKEMITGYKYEPWHYRYVGKDIAKYIHDNDLTYEEYYYEFLDK